MGKKLIILLLPLFLTSCTLFESIIPNSRGDNGNQGTGISDEDYVQVDEVEVSDKATVLDLESQRRLEKYSSETGELIFSQGTPFLRSLESGDVLVSEPIDGAPMGFLRKISSVSAQDGKILLKTESSGFVDVFKKLEARIEAPFEPSGTTLSSTHTEGLSLHYKVGGQDLGGRVKLNFDEVMIDADGDPSTEGDRLRLDGMIHYEAGLLLTVDIDWPAKLQYFRGGVAVAELVNMRVTGKTSTPLIEERKVGEIKFGTRCFHIVIPLCITGKAGVFLGINGKISLNVQYSTQQNFTARVGVEKRDGWNDINELSMKTVVNPPTLDGEIWSDSGSTSKVYAGVRPGLHFYDMAGIWAELNSFTELELLQLDTPWELYGGVEVNVGANLNFLFIDKEWKSRQYLERKRLAQSSNLSPSVKIGLRDADEGRWPFGKTATFFANTFDPEDGPGCCTVTWQSNRSGELGVTQGDELFHHSFATTGLHRITATAEDSLGATTSQTIEVDVYNTRPQAIILQPRPTKGQSQVTWYRDVPLRLEGYGMDPDTEESLSCNQLYWASSDPQDNFIAAACSLEPTFRTTGRRTISLTVSDEADVRATATVDVVVIEPPSNLGPTADIIAPSPEMGKEEPFYWFNSTVDAEGRVTDPEGDAIRSVQWYLEWESPDGRSQRQEIQQRPVNCSGDCIVSVQFVPSDVSGFVCEEITAYHLVLSAIDVNGNSTPSAGQGHVKFNIGCVI